MIWKLVAGAALAVGIISGVYLWIEHGKKQAVIADREDRELIERRAVEETLNRLKEADRSTGDADADWLWLCDYHGVECLRPEAAPAGAPGD